MADLSPPDDYFIINAEDRVFKCWGSVEIRDNQKQIIPMDLFKKYMPVLMDRGAPITIYHQDEPGSPMVKIVGKITNFEFKQNPAYNKEGLLLTCKIFKNYRMDDIAWEGVQNHIFPGLSVGGDIAVMPDGTAVWINPCAFALGKPANPGARMVAVSMAKTDDEPMARCASCGAGLGKCDHCGEAIAKCASCGKITSAMGKSDTNIKKDKENPAGGKLADDGNSQEPAKEKETEQKPGIPPNAEKAGEETPKTPPPQAAAKEEGSEDLQAEIKELKGSMAEMRAALVEINRKLSGSSAVKEAEQSALERTAAANQAPIAAEGKSEPPPAEGEKKPADGEKKEEALAEGEKKPEAKTEEKPQEKEEGKKKEEKSESMGKTDEAGKEPSTPKYKSVTISEMEKGYEISSYNPEKKEHHDTLDEIKKALHSHFTREESMGKAAQGKAAVMALGKNEAPAPVSTVGATATGTTPKPAGNSPYIPETASDTEKQQKEAAQAALNRAAPRTPNGLPTPMDVASGKAPLDLRQYAKASGLGAR